MLLLDLIPRLPTLQQNRLLALLASYLGLYPQPQGLVPLVPQLLTLPPNSQLRSLCNHDIVSRSWLPAAALWST